MEIKKGISIRDMHTFADLREATLRVERLTKEELSMGMEEQNLGRSSGKRKGNFSPSSGTPRRRNSGFGRGFQNRWKQHQIELINSKASDAG